MSLSWALSGRRLLRRFSAAVIGIGGAEAIDDFTAARQHLINALESGRLNEPETVAAREQIRRINGQLAAAPNE